MDVRLKDKQGFTLLELLMVVIIIAILASIALPQYLRATERARASEALQVLAAIRSAEIRVKAQDPAGNYTADLSSLDIDIPGIGALPVSPNWTYTVGGVGVGTNAVADRSGGFNGAAAQIQIDLDTGSTCATISVYGLSIAAC